MSGFWAGAVCAVALAAGALSSAPATATEPEWIRQFGTDVSDEVLAVATGPDGSVHVSGDVYSGVAPIFQNAFLNTLNSDGRSIWKRQPRVQGGFGRVATDSHGNVYLAGQNLFERTGRGMLDAALVKFDPAGKPLWKRLPGTPLDDTATGVAVDGNDDVYVVGNTRGSFGGPKHGRNDVFVLKFDPNGRSVWKRQFGTALDDQATAVATDLAGNVYIAGNINGGGDPETFLSKWDTNGNELWTISPVDPEFFGVSDVVTDRDGNVFVAGIILLPGGSGGDAFLVKLGPDGTLLWRRSTGAGSDTYASGVAVDGTGDVFITGSTSDALAGPNHGSYDVFVVKYDGDGNVLWKDQQGSRREDYGVALDVDGDGNIYVAGMTWGDFRRFVRGDYDAFLMKYAADAQH